MCGPVRQIELAIDVDAFVLSVGQTCAGRAHHASELRSPSWLKLELVDPDEIIEFVFAHFSISFSEPKIKSFGTALISLMKEPV
jgi:hypothetical protein